MKNMVRSLYEKEGRSLKEKNGTVLKREKNIKKINPLNELTFKRVPRENLDWVRIKSKILLCTTHYQIQAASKDLQMREKSLNFRPDRGSSTQNLSALMPVMFKNNLWLILQSSDKACTLTVTILFCNKVVKTSSMQYALLSPRASKMDKEVSPASLQ